MEFMIHDKNTGVVLCFKTRPSFTKEEKKALYPRVAEALKRAHHECIGKIPVQQRSTSTDFYKMVARKVTGPYADAIASIGASHDNRITIALHLGCSS